MVLLNAVLKVVYLNIWVHLLSLPPSHLYITAIGSFILIYLIFSLCKNLANSLQHMKHVFLQSSRSNKNCIFRFWWAALWSCKEKSNYLVLNNLFFSHVPGRHSKDSICFFSWIAIQHYVFYVAWFYSYSYS